MGLIDFSNVFLTKQNERGESVNVLNNVNLIVEQQDLMAIVGPSGSGKSSLLRLINRLDDYTKGELFIKGKEINNWNVDDIRTQIGFVFSGFCTFPRKCQRKHTLWN